MLNRNALMTALPIAAAVLLMGVACYYQGVWSERWGEFPELEIYGAQLKEIPPNIGEWQLAQEGKTDERILKIAAASGELSRTYRNAAGEEVRVMMMCARFRDVFYHTPDRCYPAAGFEMQSEPQHQVFDINNKEAQFFTTTFLKSEPTGTHAERGYWSWTADGTWLAPTNEKLTFAGERALYKLYVFGTIPTNNRGRTDEDYIGDFIRAFVPAVETALRPAIEKAERLRRGEVVAETPKAAEKPAAKPAARPLDKPAETADPAA
ncbi:MAG: exosortase-associated EpsI family protein [Pirellulales bacterium]